jgi:hypothetical protein
MNLATEFCYGDLGTEAKNGFFDHLDPDFDGFWKNFFLSTCRLLNVRYFCYELGQNLKLLLVAFGHITYRT